MTPQLFCEADRYPIGECPCVKCKKAIELGKQFRKNRDSKVAEIAIKVFKEHERLFQSLAPRINPAPILPVTEDGCISHDASRDDTPACYYRYTNPYGIREGDHWGERYWT